MLQDNSQSQEKSLGRLHSAIGRTILPVLVKILPSETDTRRGDGKSLRNFQDTRPDHVCIRLSRSSRLCETGVSSWGLARTWTRANGLADERKLKINQGGHSLHCRNNQLLQAIPCIWTLGHDVSLEGDASAGWISQVGRPMSCEQRWWVR